MNKIIDQYYFCRFTFVLFIVFVLHISISAQITISPHVGYTISNLTTKTPLLGKTVGFSPIFPTPYLGLKITYPLKNKFSLVFNSSFTQKKKVRLFKEDGYASMDFEYYRNTIFLEKNTKKGDWSFRFGGSFNLIRNISTYYILNDILRKEKGRIEYGEQFGVSYHYKKWIFNLDYYQGFDISDGEREEWLIDYFKHLQSLDISIGYLLFSKNKKD